MKSLLLYSTFALLALYPAIANGQSYEGATLSRMEQPRSSTRGGDDTRPNLEELQLVTRLPSELPQRVSGFAFDGEKFWAVIYQGRGRYATFNPQTRSWQASNSNDHHRAITEVAGSFESPGGICFANGRLWVGGSYGESFGSINMQNWSIERLFRVRQRDDGGSHSYASLAYDGQHLWIAWHWFNYRLPVSQTQLLLKIDPETGVVISRYPTPAGTRSDVTHGLTWDGARLWHIKNRRLSSIDSATGAVTAQYGLGQIRRPSGLAWDGEALWIVEFSGEVWRLPFAGERRERAGEEPPG